MRYTRAVRFLDTNILLYSISGNPEEGPKARVAAEILDSPDLALSTQVLQEFIVHATRRTRADRIEIADALALVETWLRFPIQETSVDVVRNAVHAASRWNISYWDAAIIEAARLLGCHRVLSEDLNAGQDYAGIVVTNPFSDDALS